MIMGSCPSRDKRYSDLQKKTSRRTLEFHQTRRSVGAGVRRTGREVAHSPVAGSEISRVWSYASCPPVRLSNADRSAVPVVRPVACIKRTVLFVQTKQQCHVPYYRLKHSISGS